MAGLLDVDPTAAALMALGGGMVRGDFGGGLLGAGQAIQDVNQNKLKQQFMDAQMADMAQQAELRKAQVAQMQRKQALIESAFGGQGLPSSSALGAPAAPGQLGSGSFGAAPPPAGMPSIPAPQTAPAQGGMVSSLTPDKLALLKLGADADLTDIYKLTQPQWEVTNGYRWNKNDPGAGSGFMPGMNVSQNGQATVTTIGQDGMPAVGAPRGALPTYQAYQDAEQRAKAKYDPQTYTPAGSKNPVMRSRLSVMEDANATPEPGVRGAFTGDPEVIADQIDKITNPQERANARAAFEAQMRATGGKLPQPGGIALQSPATAKFSESLATNEAGQVNDAYTKAIAAKQSLPALWQAQEILNRGTFTGMGSNERMNVIRALGSIGIQIPESVANSQEFDATISQIVGKNIKAVVGSNGISNSDVKFVQGMFGQRGQEAKAIKYILDKAVENNFREISNYNGLLPTLQAGGGQTMLGEVTPPVKQGAPVRIKNDADYGALPSGAVFIDPFGKQRRKP